MHKSENSQQYIKIPSKPQRKINAGFPSKVLLAAVGLIILSPIAVLPSLRVLVVRKVVPVATVDPLGNHQHICIVTIDRCGLDITAGIWRCLGERRVLQAIERPALGAGEVGLVL